jgi:integrase/recombinase XerD
MALTSHVKLVKKIKVPAPHGTTWTFAPALFDKKARVRPDHVLVNGRDELHTEGTYYLEWWNRGRRFREPGGPNAEAAADKARVKQTQLAAVRDGLIAPPPSKADKPRRTLLRSALDRYVDYVRYHRSLRTYRTYRPVLERFKAFCPKTHIEDVERQDLLDFATELIKEGQKGKSVYNKLVVLSQVLKQHGKGRLLAPADWPKFVKTVRPIYENEELEKLFKACSKPEEVRFKFFLISGFRDSEGRFVTWRDVNFKQPAVRVTAKPHWKFHPKNWEEREVPVPQQLIRMLLASRPEHAKPDEPLFPSATGNPDGALLEKLKAVAYRANLNCGHCVVNHKLRDGKLKVNRCADGPYCKRWFLHKFRHTYATRHLQDGIDIRTLQQWMGHRDIASTMVYLKGLRNRDVQGRLDNGTLAAFA